jgi:hypothetical protein
MFEFKSRTIRWFYLIISVHVENHDMTGSDEDHGTSRRPGADEWGWSSTGRILDGQTIKRSGDAMCGLYRTQGDEERGFLGLALKPRLTVCQWVEFSGLGLKTGSSGLVICASKSP